MMKLINLNDFLNQQFAKSKFKSKLKIAIYIELFDNQSSQEKGLRYLQPILSLET